MRLIVALFFFLLLFQGASFAEEVHPCKYLMDATKEEFGEPRSISPVETSNNVLKVTWTYSGRNRFTFYWGTSKTEACHRSGEALHADGTVRSYQNEPDGFRDLKWGSPSASLKDLHYILKDGDGTKYYDRQKDKLKIGEAKLTGLLYGFWGGKLYTILAKFKGYREWEIIKGSLFEKFGEGRPLGSRNAFGWKGDKTLIIAEFNDSSLEGSLAMYSSKIKNDIDASLNKAIKRSAETGF